MRKILLLRGGALGDFIVTLPALALLRGRWPASRIELVGNARAAELGRKEGLVDVVHSQHEARWSGLYGNEALRTEFSAWLAEFDLVVNYWPDPDHELAARFPLRSGQTFLSGPALPTRAPASAHYAEILQPLGLKLNPSELVYRLRRVVAASPRNRVPRVIAVHPGSGSPRKNWPLARWRSLCDWLRIEQQTEPLVVAGEAEIAADSARALGAEGPVARGLPLVELAARLAECRLFLGHDSGVSHLAAACGVPCVLLFGPTEPALWAPPTSDVRIVRAGTAMESISLDAVKLAVTTALQDQR